MELDGTDEFTSVFEDAEKVIVSVQGEHGMRIVVDDLLVSIKSQDPQVRYVSLMLLHSFCKVGVWVLFKATFYMMLRLHRLG